MAGRPATESGGKQPHSNGDVSDNPFGIRQSAFAILRHSSPEFRIAGPFAPNDNPCVRIHTLPAGPIETNAYLLADEQRGEAVLIDAPHGVLDLVQPLLAETRTRLVALFLTHGHWDHTGDAARIQRSGVPVFAHEADRVLIETPQSMARFMIPGLDLEPTRIDRLVVQGQHIELLGRDIEVRHVPGHCPGNVLFYFNDLESAFVGDALFNGSIGRTDLPGGSFEQLASAIRNQIYTLPDETTVYPGHGPSTTVGTEKVDNPYVPA